MPKWVIALLLLAISTSWTSAQAQGRVKLVAPADAKNNVSTQPTFRWDQAGGAQSYDIQVAGRSDMEQRVVDTNVKATTLTPENSLGGGQTYFWRVRGRSSGSTGNWSKVWSFTTKLTSPSQLDLVAPSPGEQNVSVTPTLTWGSADAAETYDLQVASDTSFAQADGVGGKTFSLIVDETQIAETEFTLPELTYGETFYWRVRGVNAVGAGPWSTRRGFITERGGSEQVQLLEPLEGALEVPLDPQLLWESVEGAASYHVQVGMDGNFAGGLVFEDAAWADTTVQIFGLTPDTLYTWRVRADNAGSKNWSRTGSFVTTAFQLQTPTLLAPSDGSSGLDAKPLLRWTAVEGAESYKVEISTSEPDDLGNFPTVILAVVVFGATEYETPSLPLGQTYFWKVEARGPEGRAHSSVWSFSVASVTSAESEAIPNDYALQPNFPNPFRGDGGTVIGYDLPASSSVLLSVFDVQGRRVVDLESGMKPAGRHQVLWRADGWASGTYFIVLRAGDFVETRAAYLSR